MVRLGGWELFSGRASGSAVADAALSARPSLKGHAKARRVKAMV